MSAATAAGPPECDDAQRRPGIVDTASVTGEATPASYADSRPPAQPPRFAVCTRKASGTVIVFQVYSTLAEATLIARRLGAVGGNAHIVEIRHA